MIIGNNKIEKVNSKKEAGFGNLFSYKNDHNLYIRKIHQMVVFADR